MADLSKVKVLGSEYNLKDAKGRADMATILGDHALEALGAAAWKAVAAEVNGGGVDLPTAEAVKSYVDSAVGKVHNFDIVIDADGSATTGPSVTASADTMYKIYLVPSGEAAAGEYIEYITIKSGNGETATFKWEAIGSTKTNLTGYVPTTTTIATIALDHNITVDELQSALKLGKLAYANTASGSDTVSTIDSIVMNEVTVAGNATVTYSDAEAVLEKAAFKPQGEITGEAIKGGSINVTLKNAATATDAVIAASSTFVPAGTVAAVEGGDFDALKSAAFQADETGVQIEGTVSAPAVTLTSAEADVAVGLTGGKVASIDITKFSGGSLVGATQASFTQGSKASFEQGSKAAFTKGTAVGAAIEGVVASVGSGDDAETLILTAADTHNVIGHEEAVFTPNGDDTFVTNGDDSFTANELGTFTPAAIAEGFFSANELQTASMGKVNNVTAAALANAPVFTGAKYKVATTADKALKTVAFTATNDVSVPTKITYLQQEVDAKTFTPEAATLGFSGTEVANLIPTKVTYKKADADAAFSEVVTPTVKTYNRTDKTVEITATPDA